MEKKHVVCIYKASFRNSEEGQADPVKINASLLWPGLKEVEKAMGKVMVDPHIP